MKLIQILITSYKMLNQAIGYATQHIWCLSQARINLETVVVHNA